MRVEESGGGHKDGRCYVLWYFCCQIHVNITWIFISTCRWRAIGLCTSTAIIIVTANTILFPCIAIAFVFIFSFSFTININITTSQVFNNCIYFYSAIILIFTITTFNYTIFIFTIFIFTITTHTITTTIITVGTIQTNSPTNRPANAVQNRRKCLGRLRRLLRRVRGFSVQRKNRNN